MQLRYLAALHDIAGERSSTIVFPMPIDTLHHLMPIQSSPQPTQTAEPPRPKD